MLTIILPLQAMMLLTTVVIYLVPVGIVFLVSSKIVSSTNLEEEFRKLGLYMATVLIGLFLHGFVILPIILFVLARKNPFRYVLSMSRALITALSTASRYSHYMSVFTMTGYV